MDGFQLSDNFIEQYKTKRAPFGFNGLGELVYMRTYSRLKNDGSNEVWYETCRRVVEGTYRMQRRWIDEHGLGWNAWQAQKSAQEMFDRMFEMKFLPPGRGLWAMGSPITEERGLYAALNNPLHIDTEVLTKEYGWIRLGDLETDSTISVLSSEKLYGRDNSNNTNSVWAPGSVSSIENHPCIEITYQSKWGDNYTVVASENHRWFRKQNTYASWERVTSMDLNVGDWLPKVTLTKNYDISYQGCQHGLFFGNGTRQNGELHQFCDDNVSLLKFLFTNVEDAPPLENEQSHVVVRQCPLAWAKIPSGEYLTDKRYLYGFLAGYFAADGCIHSGTTIKIQSARLDELTEVKRLFSLLGIRTKEIELVSTSSNYKEERVLYSLYIDSTDLQGDFFLKPKHKDWFEKRHTRRAQDWLQITSITAVNEPQQVRCITVPYYEQFVIDGFCLTSNCAFVSTKTLKDDGAKPFTFLMDASMLGVGVGFDTVGAGQLTIKGPNAKRETETSIIPDTREGWVESLRVLIESYFFSTAPIVFDYSHIRKAGESIKGFGGVSAGHKPLEELHNAVRATLDRETGSPISITAIVDIMNHIGKAVVAGNVRRTAEIVFGDAGNQEYLDLKNYKKNPQREAYGWTSNNSIFAKIGMDYTSVCERVIDNGEPGFAWLNNMREYSRMNNGPDNKDYRADGGNPCLEQTLESYELCCLVETFPFNHTTKEDYLRTLKFAYLYAKTVTLGKTQWPETNRVMLRNRRIGCSVSGVAQFITKHSIDTLRQWLVEGYDTIQEWDKKYSDWMAIPRSIKTTSVKPSGTVSLLAGATPGVHYPESRFYIRRMRLSNHSTLIKPLEKAGYTIEPCYGSEETTVVVEVPVDVGSGIRAVSEVSMWEQLSIAAFMQKYWADNQVSATITFDPATEGSQLSHALDFFQYQLKGISFLPRHETPAYRQMPYEMIDEKTYLARFGKLKKLNLSTVKGEEAEVEKGCNNDSCVL